MAENVCRYATTFSMRAAASAKVFSASVVRRRFLAGEPRRAELGGVAGDLDLAHQVELIGGETRAQQHLAVDLLRVGEAGRLVQAQRQILQ